MENMQLAIEAYKAADNALLLHRSSEFAKVKGNAEVTGRYQAYLDLDTWPESPLLLRLNQQARLDLRCWGDAFKQTLEGHHQKSRELEDARLAALHKALHLMGVLAGKELLATAGPWDERVANVLGSYDTKRRTELDGIGYVDVLDENASFAKGFYKAIGMKRVPFFADLSTCAKYREGSIKLSPEEETRLGFAEEVSDESR